ncbi:hypothetical protein GVX82_04480 [Patescibacteria group bacterium]|jgi:uncharacterized surface protein with fasciclin (FAS1) repeats|nr:hypothetical protein [Patescibacteria group bacterium]
MRGVLVAVGFGLVFGVYVIPMITHAAFDRDGIRERIESRLDAARDRLDERIERARERADVARERVEERRTEVRERVCERFADRGFGPSFCEEEPPEEPEAPTLTLSAQPEEIGEGATSELSWESERAQSCTASGGWSGEKALAGNEVVSPSATTSYTLTCEGEGGTVETSVTVGVVPAEPAPAVTLDADPLQIQEGDTSTLSWSSTDADTCTASGSWSGARDTSGSEEVAPSATSTYTLTCSGAGGTDEASVTVGVTPDEPTAPAPTVTLSADPNSIEAGGTSTLTWSSTDADTCTASDGWSGSTGAGGSEEVSPSATTTYTLTCTGPGGSADDSTTVNVRLADDPEATTILDVVAEDEMLTTLESAVVAAELTGALDDAGASLTLFAPTDAAFAALPDGLLSELLAAPTTTLRDVLLYHVVSEELDSAAVLATDTLEMLSGATTSITATGSSVFINDAEIVVLDIPTDNGIIHKIDAVLTPPEEPDPVDPEPADPTGVVLSEVLYDVGDGQGSETTNEWVEIYNGSGEVQELTDWTLEDSGGASDALPAVSLDPEQFLVVVNATDTLDLWSIPAGAAVVALEAPIGNGLGNSGDALILKNATGTIIDAVGWEGDASAFGATSTLEAPEGSSLARDLSVPDSDTEADWVSQEVPDPGSFAAPDEDEGGSGTPTSASPMVLTEVYYDPDPAHGTDAANEWVELYNTGTSSYELAGYTIEDDGGFSDLVPTTTIPAETYVVIADATSTGALWSIPGDAVVIFLESNLGNGLGNEGDALYLSRGDELVDALSWGNITDVFTGVPDVDDGHALARDPTVVPASAGDWTERDTPTPGAEAVPNSSGGNPV